MNVFGTFLFGAYIEVFQVEVVIAQIGHRRVDGLDRLGNALLELVLLDDDRIDAQAGLELDVIDRLQIGRVGDAEEQALAPLDERQHAVLVD